MLKIPFLAISVGLALFTSQLVSADTRTQAKRIHDRLAGTPPSDAVLSDMEAAGDIDNRLSYLHHRMVDCG